jgi:hypothetical protein
MNRTHNFTDPTVDATKLVNFDSTILRNMQGAWYRADVNAGVAIFGTIITVYFDGTGNNPMDYYRVVWTLHLAKSATRAVFFGDIHFYFTFSYTNFDEIKWACFFAFVAIYWAFGFVNLDFMENLGKSLFHKNRHSFLAVYP